ncbi:MAG: M20/M25/M40 family metallo-hydrolase [Chloroflexi bacterium]|nr:M20/M25/M40 family metallo-hydrolase [Chloroflexota bacterium]MCI0781751.1 M20/M25/M40 family metallo-hydrolase [Chloroflexota bacterium]MCI0786255.1 M20/M25/M40 family metallo-hydrolase [Chloroflexota bacterium]MCI0794300.1 M20/M25/M40 family metallo-hydrolase [Chloroflexota bacterium]MCI0799297.1 M20/M25/M40 family metallo-hydrolase [Chloroflexota bacterium]
MPNLDDLFSQVDAARDDILALEQALVRIPSVNTGFMPTGDETPVCEYVRDWLAEDGISSEILEAAPNRGNIIARLEGRSGKAGLMFMSHTDVVPVEDESKWRFPPFSATIADDRVFGRGSSDCKGLLTAQLMAMRLLKRNGIQLEDGLILASGADEEHGGRYGFGWLAENHPEKLAAPFAVNEGGGTPIQAAGALTYVLGVGEKGRLQVEIDVKGTSSHASVPWQGTNALYRVSQALGRIEQFDPELDTSTSLFDHLSTFAIEDKPSPGNINQIIEEIEPVNPRFASMLRALSRMTLTPTMIRGGIKSNSVPESIRLTCDVRTLPHQDEEYVRQQLDEVLAGIPGVEYEIDYMAVPNSSPFETELSRSIQTATARVLKRDNIQWVPAISNGFTDSRFTRPLGIVTYGFSGSHPDDDPMLNRTHGTDESVGIKSLISGAKIMLALACDMLGAK